MAKVRIQFKTDKTADWLDSFEPLAGELCIFSDYEDTGIVNHLGNEIYKPRIKVGTGNQALSSLLFSSLSKEKIEENDIRSLFENMNKSSMLGKGLLGSMVLGKG
jgi:hypothetical protein